MTAVINVPGARNLSPSQAEAVNAAARKIGIPPDWLFTVISFETAGTFSPTIRNPYSGAFGLIQFMPSTAQSLLGTATRDEAVRIGTSMSFREQLDRMVIPYLLGPRYNSVEDVYLKIFYPVAMNKSADYVIGSAPGAVYTQNKGFDVDGKGYITRADVTRKIRSLYDRSRDVVEVTGRDEVIAPQRTPMAQVFFGVALGTALVWSVIGKTLRGRITRDAQRLSSDLSRFKPFG